MHLFYHPDQALHDPSTEMHNGGFVPYHEHSDRVRSVLGSLGPTATPGDGPDREMAIAAVHRADYLAFLQGAFGRWQDAGRSGDALAYVWPVRRRRELRLVRIDALLGRYSFDATTPITATTWAAARASAITAIAAADTIVAGAQHAFALCRPPGHHAGADYCGGYCYLNNAAIAAQRLRDAGHAKVAVLDVDYHHGNGTQDIFWTRGDIFCASIHADPATDYPFFWGHADELGSGAGEGKTLNLPLAQGTEINGYRRALAVALGAIDRFAPSAIVVSFGADTFADDPICNFRLRTEDFEQIGGDIAEAGWPAAIVFEGGYAVEALGPNVASFLAGFV